MLLHLSQLFHYANEWNLKIIRMTNYNKEFKLPLYAFSHEAIKGSVVLRGLSVTGYFLPQKIKNYKASHEKYREIQR